MGSLVLVRGLTSFTLLVFGGAKLVSALLDGGLEPIALAGTGLSLGTPGQVLLAVSELALAALLWTRWKAWASRGVLALALAFVLHWNLEAWSGTLPSGCGCLGRIPMSPAASGLAALALLCLGAVLVLGPGGDPRHPGPLRRA